MATPSKRENDLAKLGARPLHKSGATAAATAVAVPHAAPAADVTKPDEVKNPGGRPTLGDQPMTGAERMRKLRAKRAAKSAEETSGN
jgi:hypothetical protein